MEGKRVAEMMAGDGIFWANLEFRTELLGSGFKIALAKVNETAVVVCIKETRIEPDSTVKLSKSVHVVVLLCVGLAEEQVNGGVLGVLFEQAAKDSHRRLGLADANQRRAPSKQQAGVIRQVVEKRTQDFGGFREIAGHEIAEAEKLADESVLG